MIARETMLAAAACVLTASVVNAESPTRFHRYKQIVLPAVERDVEAAFWLDADIYAATQDNLADLRIFDDADVETPFTLEIETLARREGMKFDDAQNAVSYAIEAINIEHDAAGRRTIVHVVSRREPLTAFSLGTTSDNFSRRVAIEGRHMDGARERWRSLSSARIERINLRGAGRDRLKINMATARYERYRLVIENADSPPLENIKVEAEGVVHRVAFVARTGRTYRVAYGAEGVRPGQYDLAAVLADLPREPRPQVSPLGEERTTEGYSPSPDGERSLLDNWYFIVIAIGAMTIVLCWALYGAGRRLEQANQNQPQGP